MLHVYRSTALLFMILSGVIGVCPGVKAGDRPEWLDMYADILQGSQLGPNDGWFRKSMGQTRFDWASTLKRFDKNGDGKVDRKEFHGNDPDFERIDRDHDGVLTANDFDFRAHALTMSPGAMVFMRSDSNGDGKVTKEEFESMFKRLDVGGAGFLSLSDLQNGFQASSRTNAPSNPLLQDGPTKATLIKGLFRQEIGSLQSGPSLNEKVSDFSLKTYDGKIEVMLSKQLGAKPVILIFGNFTCGPFRNQAGNIEKLYAMYKDRATFVMVYVREAHPTDGWQMESNDKVGVAIAQPRNYAERVDAARSCTNKLGFGFPVLVDTMDDVVGTRYSGMPSRLYLLDGEGKVAYKSGRGPFGFKPSELEQSLILMLQKP